MRLQRLQIKNFISIRSADINFEALNDGVFLISGPTGSGKSSMLDAIHWVLFGKTLSSNRATITKEIRSTYAHATEDTIVTLTFNQDKTDYKVTRTLKKDGGTAVQLVCPGKIYDKVKETNEMLEKIIGLSVKQFDQMVMLEQGNFTKFLLADSRSRAEILRDIFDTQLFKDIELSLKGRTDDLKNTLQNSAELERGILQGEMLETIQSKIMLAADTLKEEQANLDEFRKAQKAAQDKLPALLQYDQELAVYQKAQAELKELTALKPKIDDLYRRQSVFNEYSGILDWYDNLCRLRDDLKKSEESEADYRKRIEGIFVDSTLVGRISDLHLTLAQLNGDLASFRLVEDTEVEYQSAKSNLDVYQTRRTQLEGRIEAEQTERDSLLSRLETRRAYESHLREVSARTELRASLQKKIDSEQAYLDSHTQVYAKVLTGKLLEVSTDGVCPICGAPYSGEHDSVTESQEIQAYESAQKALSIYKADLENHPELPTEECTEALTSDSLTQKLADCRSKLQADMDEYENVSIRITECTTTIKNLEDQLEMLRGRVSGKTKERLAEELEAANKQYQELTAKSDENEMALRSRNLLEGYLKGVQEKEEELRYLISDCANNPNAIPEDSPKLREALKSRGEIDDYRLNINQYLYDIQHYEMLHNNLMSVEEPVNPFPGMTSATCQQEISDAAISIEEAVTKISDIQANRSTWLDTVRRVEDMRKERERLSETYNQVLYVYNLLSGKNSSKISFETFVLHRQLEWILQASNQYLHTLSSGQFELLVRWESASGRSQGGLEITITDHLTGSTRPAQTFSGGELFMLSLSLSLGLMTAIDSLFTTRDLNLLFVDEGFGALDQDCLSRTLHMLRELKNIKTVGIISHVQELIDTIPQGFKVEKTITGTRITLFKS